MKVKDGAEADGYTVLELADKVLAQHTEVIFVLADKIFGRFLREPQSPLSSGQGGGIC